MADVFKTGQAVKVIAPPYRTGHVIAVQGTGINAQVTVALTGWHPVTYRPAELEHA